LNRQMKKVIAEVVSVMAEDDDDAYHWHAATA
jgi:hypothetical protein